MKGILRASAAAIDDRQAIKISCGTRSRLRVYLCAFLPFSTLSSGGGLLYPPPPRVHLRPHLSTCENVVFFVVFSMAVPSVELVPCFRPFIHGARPHNTDRDDNFRVSYFPFFRVCAALDVFFLPGVSFPPAGRFRGPFGFRSAWRFRLEFFLHFSLVLDFFPLCGPAISGCFVFFSRRLPSPLSIVFSSLSFPLRQRENENLPFCAGPFSPKLSYEPFASTSKPACGAGDPFLFT